MRRSRETQLGVFLAIIDALETRRFGVTLRELAELTGLHERSVRRYLNEISERFMPLTLMASDEGSKTRWRRKSRQNPRLALTLAESLALARVGPVALRQWSDSTWVRHLRSAFDRIGAGLPDEIMRSFDETTDVNDAAPLYPNGKDRWREEFETAARERRVVLVTYRGMSGKGAMRKYEPYLVFASDGATYVNGYDHKRRDRRVLALDRVELLKVTDARFVRPSDFVPADFVAELHHGYKRVAPISVVVRVSGRAARLWTDRPEAADQSIERLTGGDLRARFTAPMSPALVARLLSFGAELVVESPRELRDAMAEELRVAVAQYEAPPLRRHRRPLAVKRANDRRVSRG